MSQTYNSSCLCGQKDEKNKCCFKIETKLDESRLEDRRCVKIETHATLPLLRHFSYNSGTPLSNNIPEVTLFAVLVCTFL